MNIELVSLPVLLALLATAAWTDLRERRVPNRLVVLGLAVAWCLHGAAMALGAVPPAGGRPWSPLAGMAVGVAVLLPLYVLRACGAGDIKLMALVGAFVGGATALMAGLGTLVAGGLVSLAYLCRKGVGARTLGNLAAMVGGSSAVPLERTAARLPYAVAIGLGTVAALLLRSQA